MIMISGCADWKGWIIGWKELWCNLDGINLFVTSLVSVVKKVENEVLFHFAHNNTRSEKNQWMSVLKCPWPQVP